jgi:hypothetical protein
VRCQHIVKFIELLKGKPTGKTFLFITEDKTIEFGSYNGPISTLYTVDGEMLTNEKAVDENKKRKPISNRVPARDPQYR